MLRKDTLPRRPINGAHADGKGRLTGVPASREGLTILVAVTGATGAQGGAVAQALITQGCEVQALVRDIGSPAAQAVAAKGATLCTGSLDAPDQLDALLAGADAVFSVQPAPTDDPDSERRQAQALVEASIRQRVRHFVQSTVSNTGTFRSMAGWEAGRWSRSYWESKGDVEAAVSEAGFERTTILRPAFMMENFIAPKVHWMFPTLVERIETAIDPDTRIALVAACDIGRVAAAAVCARDGECQSHAAYELAGDWLSLSEIAACLSQAWDYPIRVTHAAPADLVARGQSAGWVQMQQWMNEVGYQARPADMPAWAGPPTRLAAWARTIAGPLSG